MRRVRLATGVAIAYDEAGPPAADTLLLLAPMGRDHHAWDAQLPRLAAEFRCILPDYRGTGESDAPANGYSIPALADDAAALLDFLGETSTHVAGSSMGAAVAMELALSHPGRVRSLSLYTPWARTDANVAAAFGLLRTLLEHASRLDAERAVAGLVFSPGYLNENWELVEDLARTTVEAPTCPPLHAALGHLDAGIGHDCIDRLGQIGVPAFVLAGGQDKLLPPHHAAEVRDSIPGARFCLLSGPRASHGCSIELLDEFLDQALAFLRDARTERA